MANLLVQGDAQAAQVLATKKFSAGVLYGATGTLTDYSGQTLGYNPDALPYTFRSSTSDPTYRVNVAIPNPYVGKVNTDTNLDIELWGISPRFVQAGCKIGKWDSALTGTFTADATAAAGDMIAGKTAYVNGNLVTGNVVDRGAYTDAANIAVDGNTGTVYTRLQFGAYRTATGSGYPEAVNYNTNCKPGNIAAGQTVLGVAGTFTADATATASQILEGFSAGAKGAMVLGTLPNRSGGWMGGVGATANPGRMHIYPTPGYYDGNYGYGVYYDDPEFIPANIRKDANVFGMVGTLQPGYSARGSAASGAVEVTGLGFKPKAVLMRKSISSGSHNYITEYIEADSTTICWQFHVPSTGFTASSTDTKATTIDGSTYYVTDGGFKLPMDGAGTTYWYAFG